MVISVRWPFVLSIIFAKILGGTEWSALRVSKKGKDTLYK